MADLIGDDPAAEFLQQEEDQLRELGIDENQFEGGAAAEEDILGGGDAIVQDNNAGGDIMNEFEADVPAQQVTNGFADPAPVIQLQPDEEPESLKLWRDEKSASLQQQEEDEVENHKQWTERAKKELEDWYNHHNDQLDKIKTDNRAAEEQFIEEMTDTKPGNEWEKVSRFCDFNPKNTKNTKDVGRMRGILLQLKQNPLVR